MLPDPEDGSHVSSRSISRWLNSVGDKLPRFGDCRKGQLIAWTRPQCRTAARRKLGLCRNDPTTAPEQNPRSLVSESGGACPAKRRKWP
jgi:hypothetical protein